MTTPHFIAIGTVIALGVVGALQWQARQNVVTAGFWFDPGVTFELPDAARLGGPLSDDERRVVQASARAEIERAFAGLAVAVTDSRQAFYKVRVVQLLTINRRAPLSGQSNVFGPLGGVGAVGFATLANQAMSHAPPGASRAAIVEAIGRGIGRAAVHELAHQILPHVPLHATRDLESYEYWSSNRPAQFYGDMHWDLARPHLVKRLAGLAPTTPADARRTNR